MKTLVFSALIAFSTSAQDMDVVGSLKVGQMPTDNAANKLVVQKADGKLGTREINSIASTPDTSRTLGSDLEIFKSFCNCPPENMPPSMVKKLLDSGYSEEDLSLMGVSQKQIRRSKPVVDADGNIYEVLKVSDSEIGERFVLKQNLRTTKFNDGTIIIGNIPASGWINAKDNDIPAWAYPDLNATNVHDYGLLYNGHVVSGNQNPCPLGWEPISHSLITSLFPGNAEEFRAEGTNTWNFPNTGNNFTGLNVPGAGGIETDGTAIAFKVGAVFHSNVVNSTTGEIRSTRILKDSQLVVSQDYPKGYGASIRCVNDTW